MSRHVLVFVLFAAVALASEESGSSESASQEDAPDCPKNEVWSRCGKLCEPTCCVPKPEFCTTIECTEYTAACRCKRNFLRNDKQQCVRRSQCQKSCPQK